AFPTRRSSDLLGIHFQSTMASQVPCTAVSEVLPLLGVPHSPLHRNNVKNLVYGFHQSNRSDRLSFQTHIWYPPRSSLVQQQSQFPFGIKHGHTFPVAYNLPRKQFP